MGASASTSNGTSRRAASAPPSGALVDSACSPRALSAAPCNPGAPAQRKEEERRRAAAARERAEMVRERKAAARSGGERQRVVYKGPTCGSARPGELALDQRQQHSASASGAGPGSAQLRPLDKRAFALEPLDNAPGLGSTSGRHTLQRSTIDQTGAVRGAPSLRAAAAVTPVERRNRQSAESRVHRAASSSLVTARPSLVAADAEHASGKGNAWGGAWMVHQAGSQSGTRRSHKQGPDKATSLVGIEAALKQRRLMQKPPSMVCVPTFCV